MLCYTQSQILSSLLNSGGGGGGGGGERCESVDGQGCANFALDLVPQNLIFTYDTVPKNLFYKILCLPFRQGKLEWTAIFLFHE